jgi:hypothetical protein
MDIRFATLFVMLWIAHTNGAAGVVGQLARLVHVATYTDTLVIVTVGVSYRLDMDLSPGRIAVALAVSAIPHYFAARRTPLRRLSVACRHSWAWLDNVGLALVGQAWHVGWLVVAALIIIIIWHMTYTPTE